MILIKQLNKNIKDISSAADLPHVTVAKRLIENG